MILPRYRSPSIVQSLRQRVVGGTWKPRQRITTEHELAREFGVSRGTVIRSLRQLEREGLLTSRRGSGRFVVDPAERRRTQTIAIVLPDLTRLDAPTITAFAAGVRSICLDAKYHLQLFALNPLVEDYGLPSLMEQLDPQRFDGAIVDSWLLPTDRLVLLAQRMPLVTFSRPLPSARAGMVLVDLTGAFLDATAHLTSLGHRRVALVTVTPDRLQGAHQREGVRLGMRRLLEQGEGTFDVIVAPSNRSTTWLPQWRQLMARPQRPTAVIFGSDELVETGLREIKLRIPQEVSVISMNDTLAPPNAPVPLTCVRPDYARTGELAARTLLAMIADSIQTPEPAIAPAQLIIRQSTASPSGDNGRA